MHSYASALRSSSLSSSTMASQSQPIDINHPYFLSSADHPGLALVTESLNDQNYHQWSRSVQIALSTKLKLGFIDGSLVAPASTSPQFVLWKRSNDLVISWILNSVSSEIRKSIVYMNTAKQIWDDLFKRFAQSNVPRLFNLRKDLVSLTQGTQSISTYFTVFRGLLDELDNLGAIPRCKISNCPCGINAQLDEYEKQVTLSQFLMGLNEQFTTTRGHILLMKPLPDISQAYAMLLQDENQRNSTNVTTSITDSLAMNARFQSTTNTNKAKPKREDRKGLNTGQVCDYCHLSGHIKDKCFALHGYPEWHKLYGQPKPRVKHTPKTTSANAVATTGNTLQTRASDINVPELSTSGSCTDNLSDAQCQQIISMLQSKLTPSTYAPWIQNSTNSVSGSNFYSTNSVIFASLILISKTKDMWILDSGATHHITPYLNLVTNPVTIHSQLHLPNGAKSEVTHIGTIHLTAELTLRNVLVVPLFHCNLLSVPQLTHNTSATIYFSAAKCILQDHVLMMEKEIGNLSDGLYKLSSATLKSKSYLPIQALTVTSPQDSTIQQWHWRLGHPSVTVMSHIKSLSILPTSSLQSCDVCHLSKQVRLPFPPRESKSTALFEVIHCDVWGPYKFPTHGNCTKFLTIVDDYSKCTWIFLCSSKSQIPQLIIDFVKYAFTQFHKTVKIIRSDNGSEFTNHVLKTFCSNTGTLQQFSCAHTPQQNGTVERKHQHLLNVARSLRFQANLPISFWGDCVLTATHLINLLPTPVLNYKSPYEVLFQKPPDYNSLKAFGCLCYISDLYSMPDKFQPKTLRCVFLGYPFNKKGYRVMDLSTKKCYVSRDIKFVENQFPFHDIHANPKSSTHHMFPYSPFHELFPTDNSLNIPELESQSSDSAQPDHHNSTEQPSTELVTIPISRPTRIRKAPEKFKDYTGLPISTLPSADIVSGKHLAANCTYPLNDYMSYQHFSPSYTKFLCATAAIPVPYTYKQASQDSNWLKAMKLEIHAMESTNTWELVPRPANKHIVDCKWVFQIKYLPDGTIDRYKARLVAKGFTQTYGLIFLKPLPPLRR